MKIIVIICRDRQRPERLLSRMKSIKDDLIGPRVVAVRQPRGPDGTNGFREPRKAWAPPQAWGPPTQRERAQRENLWCFMGRLPVALWYIVNSVLHVLWIFFSFDLNFFLLATVKSLYFLSDTEFEGRHFADLLFHGNIYGYILCWD